MQKPVILVFASYYLPGYKAGGPIRSIENIVEQFFHEYEFFIVTSDRDLGDKEPYGTVPIKSWVAVGKAKVLYLSYNDCTLKVIHQLIHEIQPDLLYFNTFFNPCFTIKPLIIRRLGLLTKKIKVTLAPRGEFARGALVLKPWKKKIFMLFAKQIGLYCNLVWHASSSHEFNDIKRWAGKNAVIHIASNLAPQNSVFQKIKKEKCSGKLSVVCLARVARNKNIHGALQILMGVKAEIEFHLYGPCEDEIYWKECLDIIEALPPNITVINHGELPHEFIGPSLSKHDLFFLPTHGENFGHAILEALNAGLPILISNLTPWRDLEIKGIGWDLSLDSTEKFHAVLENCAAMNEVQYKVLLDKVFNFAQEISKDQKAIDANRKLFKLAIGQTF